MFRVETTMGKKLQFKDTIDFVEPQAAFSFLFGDDRFIRKFHREVNEDPDVEVSSWGEDGCREVKYTAPLLAPNLISKIVGTSVLKVTEKQQYKRCGNCFIITYDPIIDIPGRERFIMRGEMLLSPGEDRGCVITINIYLEFKSNVWGLQGAVEGFMETKAHSSFTNWIKLASSFCKEELKQSSEGLPKLEIDEYFDAEDIERPDILAGVYQSSGALLHDRSPDNNVEPVITIETWFVKSVLRELNMLHITCEASRNHLQKLNSMLQNIEQVTSYNHLEKLNAKLQHIEQDISHAKACLQDRRHLVSRGTAFSLYGAGVATGLAFAYLYIRYKQKT